MRYRIFEHNPWKPGVEAYMEVVRAFQEEPKRGYVPPPLRSREPQSLAELRDTGGCSRRRRGFKPYLAWVNPRFK
jgi:hypothetical protein